MRLPRVRRAQRSFGFGLSEEIRPDNHVILSAGRFGQRPRKRLHTEAGIKPLGPERLVGQPWKSKADTEGCSPITKGVGGRAIKRTRKTRC